MDYSKPAGETVALALLKYPSKYQVGDKRYRGPVLYNPVSNEAGSHVVD